MLPFTLYCSFIVLDLLIVSAQGSQVTRVMVLSDGRKSFRIGLAVLIQYRSVTDTQPRCRSYYALCCRAERKNCMFAYG